MGRQGHKSVSCSDCKFIKPFILKTFWGGIDSPECFFDWTLSVDLKILSHTSGSRCGLHEKRCVLADSFALLCLVGVDCLAGF